MGSFDLMPDDEHKDFGAGLLSEVVLPVSLVLPDLGFSLLESAMRLHLWVDSGRDLPPF